MARALQMIESSAKHKIIRCEQVTAKPSLIEIVHMEGDTPDKARGGFSAGGSGVGGPSVGSGE